MLLSYCISEVDSVFLKAYAIKYDDKNESGIKKRFIQWLENRICCQIRKTKRTIRHGSYRKLCIGRC
jgi:hypothetical protein